MMTRPADRRGDRGIALIVALMVVAVGVLTWVGLDRQDPVSINSVPGVSAGHAALRGEG